MDKVVRITTVPLSLDKLLTGQMRFLRENGMEVIMVSSDGEQVPKIVEREGCPHFVVPMTRAISPLRDIKSLLSMVRLMRRLKPSIVHTGTPKAGLVGMMAAWWCRVPVRVHTITGLPLMEKRGLLRKLLLMSEMVTYGCATKVQPNSKGLMKFVMDRRLVRRSKLFFLGDGASNGVDTGFFKRTERLNALGLAYRDQHGIRGEDVVFVFVGRLVSDKGVNELCSTFEKLNRRHPSSWLLLVGPQEEEQDPLREETKEIINAHQKILTVGYQEDIRPFLAASDVLVLPSYREGFPNVPMQAGCMDIPCIVTDINGCNEIIEDGINGLLIRPKDTESLERAMERMLTDRELKSACAANARAMVETRFDRERVWRLLLASYRQFSSELVHKKGTSNGQEI